MPDIVDMLTHGEPAPVFLRNAGGTAGFLLLCDHAGRLVPRALGDLGVSAADMARHIAWDIGAGGVTTLLSDHLDAVAICQNYSRLVIDCNRAPGHPTSIVTVSDGTAVPGNAGLDAAAVAARVASIFDPYHRAIAGELDRRAAEEQASVVVAVHSFTPVMGGLARPWHAGVLFNRDPRLALALAHFLRAAGFTVGENEPYALSDDSDYTIPVHGEARALPYVELEIRQDLIADKAGQAYWAKLLAGALPRAFKAAGL